MKKLNKILVKRIRLTIFFRIHLPPPVLHLLICFTIYACAQRGYELDIISVIIYSTNTCKYVIKFDVNHNKSSDYNQVSFITEI